MKLRNKKKGQPHLTTVLIIDGELGFVFWLGHLLDAASYSALPAKSVEDAALLIMQLDLTVDVLVINPALPGAPEFIAALHRSQPAVKVIGVRDDASESLSIPGLSATLTKPVIFDEEAKTEWLRGIESVLSLSMGSQ